MTSVLKNILRFTGLVVGVPVVQAHNLNLNTNGSLLPLLPQFVASNAGGFTISVTDLTVTVTRTLAAASGTVLVYVEHWHTIEEVLPPGGLATLVPFLIQPGTGGGGGGVDTDGVTIGGDGTLGNALFVIPSGLDEQVTVAVDGVTVTGDGTTANPLVSVAPPATVFTDGTTIAGDGSVGSPLAVIPGGLDEQVAVAVDGVTITGDGTTVSPLVAVIPPDTGITELTGDVLAGPGSGVQAATVAGLQGNPVAVAAPVDNQVLTWNGTAWVPGSVSNGGSGGGGQIYYLNQGTAPQAPIVNLPLGTQQFGKVAEVAAATVTSGALPTVGSVVVAGFVTDVGVPGLTAIPAGLWDYNVWASSATSTTPGEILLTYEVYVYDNVNPPTLIASSGAVPVFDPTTTVEYAASAIVPQTPILVTDRVFVEIHASALTPGQTITVYFGATTPSYVHTTLPSVAGTGIAHVVNGAFVSPASPVILSSATEVTGILPIANGGTATSTAPTNGQLLIGNAGAYSVAGLTAGANIAITPGAGSISIAASPYAVIFDDAVPGADLSIRSDRTGIQSPINNALASITNLGSQTLAINPAATGATATGATIGGGVDNTASGANSTVPGGAGNTAAGAYALAQGLLAVALRDTQHTLAGGKLLAALGGGVVHGTPQASTLVLRGSTPGAVLTESAELGYGDIGTPGIELEKNHAYLFKVTALAFGVYSGGPYGSRAYELAFIAYSTGGAPIISALGPGAVYGDVFSQTWTLTASVAAAPNRIALTFSTGGSQSECWVVARVEFSEYPFA